MKEVFQKKQYFLKKKLQKTFVWGHDHFEGKGASGDKNQKYTFFVGNEVLNIFYLTIFSKQTNFPR